MKVINLSVITLWVTTLPVVASITVTLTPDLASPRPVGTSIVFTAVVTNTSPGAHDYRFTAQKSGTPVQVLRDYGVSATWT